MYRKDARHWIRINVRTVKDKSGKILYYEGTHARHHEVEKLAEEQLKRE